jgi:CRP-like cAMP-binding protein
MTDLPSQATLVHLGKAAIFRDLDTSQLNEILANAYRVEIKRREFLFHQGEPADTFYIILEGNARLTQISPEGCQVTIHYFGPGDVMAIAVVFADAEYPVSAEATSDCVFLAWDKETAVRYMEQYPQLAINSMVIVAERFWELQNRYRELATQRVERRVANAVLRLSRQGNGQSVSQPLPTLSLSRQELAEMTGTTLFTVSRICSQWEQQGLLTSGREQITVIRPEELVAIAEDISSSTP